MKKSLFQKVGDTSIIPISLKILFVFVVFLLLSNFTTNYISMLLQRKQIINLSNTILVSQLKDIYMTAGNQAQIYSFTGDRESSLSAIQLAAEKTFEYQHSIAFAVTRDGDVLFESSAPTETSITTEDKFPDENCLAILNENFENGKLDGSLLFSTSLGNYFGVFKYSEDWKCFFVRAELRGDTQKSTWVVMGIISLIICGLVALFLLAGVGILKRILGNVKKITQDLYEMQQNQQLTQIDLSGSPNDDVTYLAASFNSLSSTINNLLGIFQKFVSKDVVAKAYNEHVIRLEGNQKNLTILFSDIRSFTYRTETLGNDIIDLLNVHYDRVIHAVHEYDGVVGSIIGDAILAIYGTVGENTKEIAEKKSLKALDSAWEITRVTALLREKMIERRKEIEKTRSLTEAEDRIYKAVLIDIGVGIDGGNVFYGNIGSKEHMANTVIGDRVNSASRLEGLTRIYSLPVIISDYIKTEVENASGKYRFFEIDTVQVKGKTEGVKIYFPLEKAATEDGIEEKFEMYEKGLKNYYEGKWNAARKSFKESGLDAAKVFLDRMGKAQAPENWSGIWTMETK